MAELQGCGIMDLDEELRAQVVSDLSLNNAFIYQEKLDAQKHK